MATNEDRRRVAEALRAKYRERTEGRTFGPQCIQMQYEAYLRDLESCLPDGESMFTVLADLIDPGCDRKALLALADGMLSAFRVGARCGEGIDARWCRELHDDYARRIREACGEVCNG